MEPSTQPIFDTENINKTIVISYDDASRMVEFCCDKENGGGVSRAFMDWYINENSFFSVSGMLLVENIYTSAPDNKIPIAFDFSNPDFPEFCIYEYFTQKIICKYVFSREGNMGMDKIVVKMNFFDKNAYASQQRILMPLSMEDELYAIRKRMSPSKHKNDSKRQLRALLNEAKSFKSEFEARVQNYMAHQAVYWCYATMYYFAKNKPKEVMSVPKGEVGGMVEYKQVKSIYKYTGYININSAKTYVPVIKKDRTEPLREYGRHIEQWSVRGHYRRVNGKVIWIEPHVKGSGELEKRVYGTTKEEEVNIRPKVFEVTKNVPINVEASENKVAESSVIKMGNPKAAPDNKSKSENVTNSSATMSYPIREVDNGTRVVRGNSIVEFIKRIWNKIRGNHTNQLT